MLGAIDRGRTAAGSEDRAAPDYEVLVLHCPTGHLSAAVAGIACGQLPVGRVPEPGLIRGYFAREMRRRGQGRVNVVTVRHSGRTAYMAQDNILCLARRSAGALTEAALSELARVSGRRLFIQPAIRAAGARAGRGQSPVAPRRAPDPALYAASLAARALGAVSLHRLADAIMARQVRRLYPELVSRASTLPGPSLRRRLGPEEDVGPGVRVVYHCFGAAHSSVSAAALHCGQLPASGRVTARDVLAVPGFDRRGGDDIGGAFYFGCDRHECEVYVIGFDGSRRMITTAASELLAHLRTAGRHVLLAETLPAASVLVKVGGYSSRRLGLVRLGRPLAALGIVLSIPALRRTVTSTQLRALSCRQGRGETPAPGAAGTAGTPRPVAGRGSHDA